MRETPATVYILLAHGSRQEEANAAFAELTGRVAAAAGLVNQVIHAFWEIARPDLKEAAREAVEVRGARRVAVLPYFLMDGIHIRRDIPETLEQLRGLYPGVSFDLLPSLQNDPLMETLLVQRLKQAQSSPRP
ncbi:MAG TPA: CbiX/SirB N-terminal domain-containing protein [Candidatus Hydrogenedentes bacterium]|nr:CbiX/SirB N-terminal domain-containing protein [Candidatus Hydrogenedentota bacterium]